MFKKFQQWKLQEVICKGRLVVVKLLPWDVNRSKKISPFDTTDYVWQLWKNEELFRLTGTWCRHLTRSQSPTSSEHFILELHLRKGFKWTRKPQEENLRIFWNRSGFPFRENEIRHVPEVVVDKKIETAPWQPLWSTSSLSYANYLLNQCG